MGEGGVVAIAEGTARSVKRRWIVALVLLGLVVTGFFDRISIAVLFTNADFYTAIGTGFNPPLLGMLMTAFLIPYGISAFFLSFTGDKYGPRRVLSIATVVWGALMVFIGGAASYGALIVYRVLLGTTEGPQFSWIMKVVNRWFPRREHGRANAIWLIGSPLGSAIGFPLTIWLVASYGWRASFYALAALNIFLMLPLLLIFVRDWPPHVPAAERVDTGAKAGFWQDCKLFIGDRRFWLLTIYDCGAVIFLWGLNSWLPTYLQKVRGFDIQHLGFYSSLPFVLVIVGEVLSGTISDWLGKRAILLFIGLFSAGVLIYVATIVSNPTTAALVIALSAGFWGLTVPSIYALTLEFLPPSVVASGTGVINGIANTVGACAPFAMGYVMARTNDFNTGLLLLTVSCLACSLAILPLVKRY